MASKGIVVEQKRKPAMGCRNCGHPASAHYPTGCYRSMWGGVCEKACRMYDTRLETQITESEQRVMDGNR